MIVRCPLYTEDALEAAQIHAFVEGVPICGLVTALSQSSGCPSRPHDDEYRDNKYYLEHMSTPNRPFTSVAGQRRHP